MWYDCVCDVCRCGIIMIVCVMCVDVYDYDCVCDVCRCGIIMIVCVMCVDVV